MEKIFQVDSFTSKPFAGNPAAVCLLRQAAGESWMQHIAAEMNLSETAFLLPEGDGFQLRWFTPSVEVNLCGHATLAAAHILYSVYNFDERETLRFFTRSGELRARKSQGLIWLDFPVTPPQPLNPPEELLRRFKSPIVDAARNDEDWLLELSSPDELRTVRNSFSYLEEHPPRGLILTCRSDTEGYDFLYRYFAPWVGVDEDPVTGSAQVMLAPYWKTKCYQHHFQAWQASRRGGALSVQLKDDRVFIGGEAVTVFDIELKHQASEHQLPEKRL